MVEADLALLEGRLKGWRDRIGWKEDSCSLWRRRCCKLLRGLVEVVAPHSITAIVNTGDDLSLHGLHISPDIDTVIYTLGNEINPDTGWGLRARVGAQWIW